MEAKMYDYPNFEKGLSKYDGKGLFQGWICLPKIHGEIINMNQKNENYHNYMKATNKKNYNKKYRQSNFTLLKVAIVDKTFCQVILTLIPCHFKKCFLYRIVKNKKWIYSKC